MSSALHIESGCAESENWRPVVGFENYYEVSDLGNVRRKKSGRLRKIDFAPIYPTILLSVNGVHTTIRVHRLVAEAFLPPIEGKNHVNHKDGNHKNNRLDNLEWCTQRENNLHAYRVLHRRPPLLGRTPPNRKVKGQDVVVFYELNKNGMTTDDIGAMYGVCGSTVRKHIRKYKSVCTH